MSDDLDPGELAFERDLALRQAKVAKSNLQLIRWALNDNRPLRALHQANDALDELNRELEVLEDGR